MSAVETAGLPDHVQDAVVAALVTCRLVPREKLAGLLHGVGVQGNDVSAVQDRLALPVVGVVRSNLDCPDSAQH